MQFLPNTLSRAAALTAGTVSLILALTGCTPDRPADTTPSPQATTGLPSAHVHGLAVTPQTSQILLATHVGLFDMTRKPASKIGDTNDLMGFTTGKNGALYASGHPGPGSELPNPLGLIRSTDGGETWEHLSRQGDSDFHAITTTKSGIVAFDGQLRTSPDGKTWDTATAGFTPAALAGHPDTDTVLATTPQGIQRSTTSGATWKPVNPGPVIQFAAFADALEAVGVAPDGTTYYSTDAGASWTKKGTVDTEVLALTAHRDNNGKPKIWAATGNGIIVSTDAGTTFQPADGR
ncbi:F510_1955 family glycosylhydrolase [Paenarthrobacter ureafaciens]|uniref:F510_1955 family glycosylhydrolase n=1 Tax=Paenarthrobacter ureafaciens TaxID=37931 RepID=UPI00140ABE1F|nr:exo-alpha-sialidase [Paenarthrobacter ureafaciens]MCX8454833.1 exo-alpha-sialidase [Paenarthrobacter ureafaciens]MCY0975385.1 exo-alpha-sialidase [Paenarthrobacter ureafaciens]MCY0975586.1 exo-alpha-sialidase [Paenarthrobacter ureafaciens]